MNENDIKPKKLNKKKKIILISIIVVILSAVAIVCVLLKNDSKKGNREVDDTELKEISYDEYQKQIDLYGNKVIELSRKYVEENNKFPNYEDIAEDLKKEFDNITCFDVIISSHLSLSKCYIDGVVYRENVKFEKPLLSDDDNTMYFVGEVFEHRTEYPKSRRSYETIVKPLEYSGEYKCEGKVCQVVFVDEYDSKYNLSLDDSLIINYPLIYDGDNTTDGAFKLYDIKNNVVTKLNLPKHYYNNVSSYYISDPDDVSKLLYIILQYSDETRGSSYIPPISEATGSLIYDVRSNKVLYDNLHGNPAYSLRFSKDGRKLLVLNTWENTKLFDIKEGKELKKLTSYNNDVSEQSAFQCEFVGDDKVEFISCLYGSFGEGPADKITAFTLSGKSINAALPNGHNIYEAIVKDGLLILNDKKTFYYINGDGKVVKTSDNMM